MLLLVSLPRFLNASTSGDCLLPGYLSRQECIWYVSFLVSLVSLARLEIHPARREHFAGVSRYPSSSERRERQAVALPPDGGGRRDQAPVGKCPRRTMGVLPGRPQGSGNLPWDVARIAAKRGRPPEGGGWDGGFACARDVGGGIRPGSGTSGTAKTPSVCGWCVVGRRRSGNGSVGRRRRRVRGTPRRSVPDGSKVEPGAGRPLVKILSAWIRLRPRARGHAAKSLFRGSCATGQAVTSLRAMAAGRRPRIVAMRAVRPCGG